MSLKPILFNTEMVRALLEGRKTVTRRVVKPQPCGNGMVKMPDNSCWSGYWAEDGSQRVTKPPYQPGDVLYVRETFRVDYLSNIVGSGRVRYKADGSYADIHFSADRYDIMRRAHRMVWRSSENMPREAARIFLRVTGVRVERLQDIYLIDCEKEGVQLNFIQETNLVMQGILARKKFAEVWDNTIKPADRVRCGWEANPWVWVIEFERVEKPAKNDLDGEKT